MDKYIKNRNLINDCLNNTNMIQIPYNIISVIIGERNHEWWTEVAQNKPFLNRISSCSLTYGVFDNDIPSNIISFCHDYLNHSFIAFYIDIHINYDFSDIDHIKFNNKILKKSLKFL